LLKDVALRPSVLGKATFGPGRSISGFTIEMREWNGGYSMFSTGHRSLLLLLPGSNRASS
jgi:hypothetical protein